MGVGGFCLKGGGWWLGVGIRKAGGTHPTEMLSCSSLFL